MYQFIDDCLKPLFQLKWLNTLTFSNEYLTSLRFYIAYSDNRLLV